MNWTVPTIGGIQRATGILAAIATAILAVAVSPAAAMSCAVGAALMIANLFLLTVVGRAIIAMAQGGAASKAGVILAPMKLFLFVGVVYILIAYTHLDLRGFMIGALTQILAIFVETWHASSRAIAVHPEDQNV
jgi:small-conductance mechanosensitive channel